MQILGPTSDSVPAWVAALARAFAPEAREQLVKMVGEEWLGYAANASVEHVRAWRAGAEQGLSDVGVLVLDAALGLAAQVTGVGAVGPAPPGAMPPSPVKGFHHADLARLSFPRAELDGSVVDALRRAAGGLPATEAGPPPSGDPLQDTLCVLALQAWPTLLLPPPPRNEPSGSLVYSTPTAADARRLLLEDPHIAALFPDVNEYQPVPGGPNWGVSSDVLLSDGTGGTLFLLNLPAALIAYAHLTVQLAGRELTPEGLCLGVSTALNRLRALSRREPVEVPTFIAMSKLDLSAFPDGVDTPLGRLRPAVPADTNYLPPQRHVAERPTAVLETTSLIQLLEVQPMATGGVTDDVYTSPKYRAAMENTAARDTRRLLLVRAALLLAQPDRARLLAPVVHGTKRPDLLNPGPRSGFPLAPYRVLPAQPLEPEALERARLWMLVLQRQHPTSLDLALRRLVAAATERLDPTDGFVDAVIAWEAMFSEKTETGLRVTCSVAICCEPEDEQKRLALQRELSALYGARSTVVHGGASRKPRSVYDDRAAAIEYALRALTWLHLARAEILSEQASERSRILLLLGPGTLRALEAVAAQG